MICGLILGVDVATGKLKNKHLLCYDLFFCFCCCCFLFDQIKLTVHDQKQPCLTTDKSVPKEIYQTNKQKYVHKLAATFL